MAATTVSYNWELQLATIQYLDNDLDGDCYPVESDPMHWALSSDGAKTVN